MSFFKKIFGFGKNSKPSTTSAPQKSPTKSAASSSPNDEPIKAFDKYGREMLISRADWLNGVLLEKLKTEWNKPDELAASLIQSFSDGFFAEVEKAAKQLHAIDTDPSRGAALLGIVYLKTDRPSEAERVLTSNLKKHGENAVVLTNLAKAQDALGRHDEAENTLWHALQLDPNQDNAVGWYVVINREKNGEAAGLDALKRIATIPASWRARLWLARAALESRDLASAMVFYEESLSMAGSPIPCDLLMQMSGDLGNQGHLPEILQLVGSNFDVEVHGIEVGNNLIKASIDTGHVDNAQKIIRQLQACQRPDWRETLGFWENELLNAKLQTQAPIPSDKLKMNMLTLDGPLWMIADHATSRIAAKRSADATHVVFLGSSFDTVNMPTDIAANPADGPGRMSRALPLFLNETVHLHSDARTTTLIPWITNGGGGFGLFGEAPDLAEMAHVARQIGASDGGMHTPDFLVSTHLITRGENWKLQMALVRTIDGETLFSRKYDFAEANFRPIADQVQADLLAALAKDADVETRMPAAITQVQQGELDHYLFRLEQTLAVRCSNMDGTMSGFLSNPAEILDGLIYLCLQNPRHLPSRILLWRVIDALKGEEAALVKSIATKVHELQTEHPLELEFHDALDAEFNSIFIK